MTWLLQWAIEQDLAIGISQLAESLFPLRKKGLLRCVKGLFLKVSCSPTPLLCSMTLEEEQELELSRDGVSFIFEASKQKG